MFYQINMVYSSCRTTYRLTLMSETIFGSWNSLKNDENWSLLNCLPYSLTSQGALRAHVPTRFARSRAHASTRQRALRAYMLTCQRALRAFLLTCHFALRAHVPMFLTCLRGNLSCVPTCLRALTSNNKNKFSMTCFSSIWNKTVYDLKSAPAWMSLETSILRFQFYIPAFSLTRQKPLTGAMTNFL